MLNFELVVEIRRGFNLIDKKLIERPSIYIEVSVDGGQHQRTAKVEDYENPIWNETLRFGLNSMPNHIIFQVKDDRTLLPDADLGYYDAVVNQPFDNNMVGPFRFVDGIVVLQNTPQGRLDLAITFDRIDKNEFANSNNTSILETATNNGSSVMASIPPTPNPTPTSSLSQNIQSGFHAVDKSAFEKLPNIIYKRAEIVDNHEDELKYNLSKREVHVLPALHLKDKPVIIEREIEYEKPVEIHQTILHQEKPIIIERPIIHEKHEHYLENAEYIRKEEKIVTEKVSEQDTGTLDQEELVRLREQRVEQFSDVTPIVYHDKEHIKLDTERREQPVQVHEKEVIYEQPVEIVKTEIEKIKPVVVEEITLEKEHVHQKLAPKIQVEQIQRVFEGDEYYSADQPQTNDATSSLTTTTSLSSSTTTNKTDDRQQNVGPRHKLTEA